MKKQIKVVLGVIVGIIAVSVLAGCASGPNFGNPSDIQRILNNISGRFPINIAGKQVQISFEGDFWRAKVNGKDLLAGEMKIEDTADGAIITLNQSWAYLDTGKKVPITGEPVAKWQKTPGPEIVLVYRAGPPASISRRGE